MSINDVETAIERDCKDYPERIVAHEVLWFMLLLFEKASIAPNAAREVLQNLPIHTRRTLTKALRVMLEWQPDAMTDGYMAFSSIGGVIPGLEGASYGERFIPPEWLRLVAELEDEQ